MRMYTGCLTAMCCKFSSFIGCLGLGGDSRKHYCRLGFLRFVKSGNKLWGCGGRKGRAPGKNVGKKRLFFGIVQRRRKCGAAARGYVFALNRLVKLPPVGNRRGAR